MKTIFLYRTKSADDRDCCAYLDEQPRFECGHYFASVQIGGACYSGKEWEAYDEIETILTADEYARLVKYRDEIAALGYGIKEGDERHAKGLALYGSVKDIFDKLESDEAKDFRAGIEAAEMEYLKDEYNLTADDINDIFDFYTGEYKDRAVVSYIFKNIEECAEEEAEALGMIDGKNPASKYFDYEAFGDDLLADCGRYLQLRDGRVVMLEC